MSEKIMLSHGSGGKLAHELVDRFFVSKFGMDSSLTDSAIIQDDIHNLAFTTDSYVVDPIFFPGGDIGKMAICGTVNDLSVSGAIPKYISVSVIIEEGFLLSDLDKITSSMAKAAKNAGVDIVTGDTKVVDHGKCDKIFINTAGVGILTNEFQSISKGENIQDGDIIIINGFIAEHAVAILGARENITYNDKIVSDCACLNGLIHKVLSQGIHVKFMRDITRGGIATVLNELAALTNHGIYVDESSIPVKESVRGVCEAFGFDPLYMANEGKVLMVVDKKDAKRALEILMNDSLGESSCVIGNVVKDHPSKVILKTQIGGKRILDMLTGMQLPRIC